MLSKILLILTVFILIISYVYAAEGQDELFCHGAAVCPNIDPGNYSILCKSVSDGFCPEDYAISSWNNCPVSTKCVPCDPDCGLCNDVNIYVQPAADPCAQITNTIIANPSDSINIFAFRGDGSNGYNNSTFGPERCNSGTSCMYQFQDSLLEYQRYMRETECFGGQSYYYSACSVPPGIGVDCEVGSGMTRPYLELISPVDKTVSGKIDVKVLARTKRGIIKFNSYLTKWDAKFNKFRPVNINVPLGHPDYCSFRLTCNAADPVECSYFFNYDYEINEGPEEQTELRGWDTIGCENAKFTITSYAQDPFLDKTLNSELFTSNPNAPCTDYCPIFTSKTLNTLLAKIKTWVS